MKPYHVVAAAFLLVACQSIMGEELCGCSPPEGGSAVIAGTVTSPAAVPEEGAEVRVRLMANTTCAEVEPTIVRTATTDAGGRFRHVEAWSGGSKCFQVWAEPPQGSPLAASERHLVRIEFGPGQVQPDSTALDLQLR
jgi:hypothetical protein